VYRIPLRVGNIDLEDEEFACAASKHLAHIAWTEVGGRVVAVLSTDSGDPVGAAVQAARQIAHALPQAVVHEVDQDLVGVSDIAHRIGVTREAVRMWVDGKRGPGRFPDVVAAVSEGSRGPVRLWRWAEVAGWLRSHYGLREHFENLLGEEVARVNAALQRVRDDIDDDWQMTQRSERQLTRTPAGSEVRISLATGLPRHLAKALTRHLEDRSLVDWHYVVTLTRAPTASGVWAGSSAYDIERPELSD
jgi:hypothetical protein